eukprot:g9935.t1
MARCLRTVCHQGTRGPAQLLAASAGALPLQAGGGGHVPLVPHLPPGTVCVAGLPLAGLATPVGAGGGQPSSHAHPGAPPAHPGVAALLAAHGLPGQPAIPGGAAPGIPGGPPGPGVLPPGYPHSPHGAQLPPNYHLRMQQKHEVTRALLHMLQEANPFGGIHEEAERNAVVHNILTRAALMCADPVVLQASWEEVLRTMGVRKISPGDRQPAAATPGNGPIYNSRQALKMEKQVGVLRAAVEKEVDRLDTRPHERGRMAMVVGTRNSRRWPRGKKGRNLGQTSAETTMLFQSCVSSCVDGPTADAGGAGGGAGPTPHEYESAINQAASSASSSKPIVRKDYTKGVDPKSTLGPLRRNGRKEANSALAEAVERENEQEQAPVVNVPDFLKSSRTAATRPENSSAATASTAKSSSTTSRVVGGPSASATDTPAIAALKTARGSTTSRAGGGHSSTKNDLLGTAINYATRSCNRKTTAAGAGGAGADQKCNNDSRSPEKTSAGKKMSNSAEKRLGYSARKRQILREEAEPLVLDAALANFSASDTDYHSSLEEEHTSDAGEAVKADTACGNAPMQKSKTIAVNVEQKTTVGKLPLTGNSPATSSKNVDGSRNSFSSPNALLSSRSGKGPPSKMALALQDKMVGIVDELCLYEINSASLAMECKHETDLVLPAPDPWLVSHAAKTVKPFFQSLGIKEANPKLVARVVEFWRSPAFAIPGWRTKGVDFDELGTATLLEALAETLKREVALPLDRMLLESDEFREDTFPVSECFDYVSKLGVGGRTCSSTAGARICGEFADVVHELVNASHEQTVVRILTAIVGNIGRGAFDAFGRANAAACAHRMVPYFLFFSVNIENSKCNAHPTSSEAQFRKSEFQIAMDGP